MPSNRFHLYDLKNSKFNRIIKSTIILSSAIWKRSFQSQRSRVSLFVLKCKQKRNRTKLHVYVMLMVLVALNQTPSIGFSAYGMHNMNISTVFLFLLIFDEKKLFILYYRLCADMRWYLSGKQSNKTEKSLFVNKKKLIHHDI